MRRMLVAFAAALVILASPAHAQLKPAPVIPDFKVTLLGTGSPAPIMKRLGPGTLMQVADGNVCETLRAASLTAHPA